MASSSHVGIALVVVPDDTSASADLLWQRFDPYTERDGVRPRCVIMYLMEIVSRHQRHSHTEPQVQSNRPTIFILTSYSS